MLDGIERCLDRETDERYRKVLEARIERFKARWEELTKEDAVKPSTATPTTPGSPPKPSEDEVKAAKDSTAAKNEKLGLRVEDFKSYYNELTKKDVIELNEKRAGQDGYLTKTQASLVLLPNLNMFQPAVIQSFSLRNIFQAFNPNSDPTDVRAEVETDLARKRIVTVEYEYEHKDKHPDAFDMNRLSPEQFQLAVDAIADERLAHRWWHTRADLFSLDVGLAHPDVAVGNNSKSFKRRVDEGLPEFLFGGGVHFGSLELSSGVVLYRQDGGTSAGNSDATAGDFRVAYYIGFTLEIFQKNIQFN